MSSLPVYTSNSETGGVCTCEGGREESDGGLVNKRDVTFWYREDDTWYRYHISVSCRCPYCCMVVMRDPTAALRCLPRVTRSQIDCSTSSTPPTEPFELYLARPWFCLNWLVRVHVFVWWRRSLLFQLLKLQVASSVLLLSVQYLPALSERLDGSSATYHHLSPLTHADFGHRC